MSSEDRGRDLLERVTVAIGRLDSTMALQAESHEQMMRRMDRRDDLLVEAIGDIDLSLKRNADRLEDMGDAIRANTQAVLSVLDRLGPANG